MCLYVFERDREGGGEERRDEGWREGKYKGNHDQEGRDFAGGREVNRICDISRTSRLFEGGKETSKRVQGRDNT